MQGQEINQQNMTMTPFLNVFPPFQLNHEVVAGVTVSIDVGPALAQLALRLGSLDSYS